MAPTLREGILAAFGHTVVSDDKLLNECMSICETYDLSPEGLFWKWEALKFSPSSVRSEDPAFTMDSVAALKAQILRDRAKNSSKDSHRRTIAMGTAAMVNRSRLPVNMLKTVNPGAKAGVAQLKREQTGAGPSSVVYRGPKTDTPSKKRRAYRYMYEKISERSEALDNKIDEIGEAIRLHYKIADLGDPSSSTDDEITVVGRITHDSDSVASTSKLTDATVTLESSRMLASGARVPLRFDPALKIRGGAQSAGGVGLFPGAIVALRGKNGGGGWFLATEILAIPPLRPSPLSLGQPNPKEDPGLDQTPFSMCVVSGPYTPDADLAYKPWHTLLTSLKSRKPAVLLLIGPFIDVAHPKIKVGDVDTTPTDIFRHHFFDPLRLFLDSSPGSIILIVPSVRDLISQQSVYPQSEFELELSDADPRIHLLPNPARFSINDVTFAVSSVDVIFHLRKEEFFKRGQEVESISPLSVDDIGTDPMANLCRHLLQQRSFYPVFPVPLDVSDEVNLDVTHWDGLRLDGGSDDGHAPDVLIVPSRLKYFSKTVHTTTALNPSFLTKGTYSIVDVAAGGTSGGLKDRLRTEVLKLNG